ncbi:hypothetical protein U1Q18_013209 [Sarracenia purpurea var. burkii]
MIVLRRRAEGDEAKRHFVQGAQLLAQAQLQSRSATDKSVVASLAKFVAEESNCAITLNPKDAAAHIFKALSLDLQGFKASALDSLNVTLSPMAAKTLSNEERRDALLKRAELEAAMGQIERVDSAIADLVGLDLVRSF